MNPPDPTHPFFGIATDQGQCQGAVFIVLNGDPSLYDPIRKVLTNAEFSITAIENHWFQRFWKIQRQASPAQTQNPTASPADSRRTPVSLNSLVENFKAQWSHLAPATRTKFECHFEVAKRFLNFDRDVRDICLADMRELKSNLSEKRKPVTVNDIIFKALASLFTLALEDGIIDRSPLERLKRAKRGEIRREQPSWTQSQQIVDEVAKSTSETGLIVPKQLAALQAPKEFRLGDQRSVSFMYYSGVHSFAQFLLKSSRFFQFLRESLNFFLLKRSANPM